MKLFIANCTKQESHFVYRILEVPGTKVTIIPIGGQTQVGTDNLSTPQVDAIIEQHRVYGLASVDEFERMKEFVPLVFSVGKPVTADVIRRVMALNNGVLVQRGRDMRQQAALAVNASISEMTPSLETLEMSVTEESRGSFTDGDPMAEGVRVTRDPNERPAPRRGGRPRKAA